MKHVWIHPKGNANKVVIMTREAILLSNPNPRTLKAFTDSVHAGELRSALLAEDIQVIPLRSVLRLQSDRQSPRIRIVHGHGGKPSVCLAEFDASGTRDNAFESLRKTLGPGYRLAGRETGKLKSGWQPLAMAALVTLLAVFLRGSAVQAAGPGTASEPEAGLALLDPSAVSLIALGLVAYFVREFYRRTQAPSPLLELVRD